MDNFDPQFADKPAADSEHNRLAKLDSELQSRQKAMAAMHTYYADQSLQTERSFQDLLKKACLLRENVGLTDLNGTTYRGKISVLGKDFLHLLTSDRFQILLSSAKISSLQITGLNSPYDDPPHPDAKNNQNPIRPKLSLLGHLDSVLSPGSNFLVPTPPKGHLCKYQFHSTGKDFILGMDPKDRTITSFRSSSIGAIYLHF